MLVSPAKTDEAKGQSCQFQTVQIKEEKTAHYTKVYFDLLCHSAVRFGKAIYFPISQQQTKETWKIKTVPEWLLSTSLSVINLKLRNTNMPSQCPIHGNRGWGAVGEL